MGPETGPWSFCFYISSFGLFSTLKIRNRNSEIKMSQGSNFVDYVKICCRSGHGGAGSAHLHRDILTSKGGPDGGDGGRGGHVI
ncbi:MAG TPA: hypothetical protein VK671_05220, partial [Mucilaginibacter sp.]|nr:hypothetical protein [Mucilaginibacter sp.]